MKVVSVRHSGVAQPVVLRDYKGNIVRDANGEPEYSSSGDLHYQAGIYKLSRRKRDGILYFILDGTIGGLYQKKKACEAQARKTCKEKKDEYIYVDRVRHYTHLSTLPEDLATYLDFELAIEEGKNETA